MEITRDKHRSSASTAYEFGKFQKVKLTALVCKRLVYQNPPLCHNFAMQSAIEGTRNTTNVGFIRACECARISVNLHALTFTFETLKRRSQVVAPEVDTRVN